MNTERILKISVSQTPPGCCQFPLFEGQTKVRLGQAKRGGQTQEYVINLYEQLGDCDVIIKGALICLVFKGGLRDDNSYSEYRR